MATPSPPSDNVCRLMTIHQEHDVNWGSDANIMRGTYWPHAESYYLFVSTVYAMRSGARRWDQFVIAGEKSRVVRPMLQALQVFGTICSTVGDWASHNGNFVKDAEHVDMTRTFNGSDDIKQAMVASRDHLPIIVPTGTLIRDKAGQRVGYILQFSHSIGGGQDEHLLPAIGDTDAKKAKKEKELADRRAARNPNAILERCMSKPYDVRAYDRKTEEQDRAKKGGSLSKKVGVPLPAVALDSKSKTGEDRVDADPIGIDPRDNSNFINIATKESWLEVCRTIVPDGKINRVLALGDYKDPRNPASPINVFSLKNALHRAAMSGACEAYTNIDHWKNPHAGANQQPFRFPIHGKDTYRLRARELHPGELFGRFFPDERRVVLPLTHPAVVTEAWPNLTPTQQKGHDQKSTSARFKALKAAQIQIASEPTVKDDGCGIDKVKARCKERMARYNGKLPSFDDPDFKKLSRERRIDQLRCIDELNQVYNKDEQGLSVAVRSILLWIEDNGSNLKCEPTECAKIFGDLSTFADSMSRQLLQLESVHQVYQSHREALLLLLLCAHVYKDCDMHPHHLLVGPAETGKSYLAKLLVACFIPGTVKEITGESAKANYTADSSTITDKIHVCEEASLAALGISTNGVARSKNLDPDKFNGSADSAPSEMASHTRNGMTSNRLRYDRLVKNAEGGLKKEEIDIHMNILRVWIANIKKSELANNMATRFLVSEIFDQKRMDTDRLEKIVQTPSSMTKEEKKSIFRIRRDQAMKWATLALINAGVMKSMQSTISDGIELWLMKHAKSNGVAGCSDTRSFQRLRSTVEMVVIEDAIHRLIDIAPLPKDHKFSFEWLLNIEPLLVATVEHVIFSITLLGNTYQQTLLGPLCQSIKKLNGSIEHETPDESEARLKREAKKKKADEKKAIEDKRHEERKKRPQHNQPSIFPLSSSVGPPGGERKDASLRGLRPQSKAEPEPEPEPMPGLSLLRPIPPPMDGYGDTNWEMDEDALDSIERESKSPSLPLPSPSPVPVSDTLELKPQQQNESAGGFIDVRLPGVPVPPIHRSMSQSTIAAQLNATYYIVGGLRKPNFVSSDPRAHHSKFAAGNNNGGFSPDFTDSEKISALLSILYTKMPVRGNEQVAYDTVKTWMNETHHENGKDLPILKFEDSSQLKWASPDKPEQEAWILRSYVNTKSISSGGLHDSVVYMLAHDGFSVEKRLLGQTDKVPYIFKSIEGKDILAAREKLRKETKGEQKYVEVFNRNHQNRAIMQMLGAVTTEDSDDEKSVTEMSNAMAQMSLGRKSSESVFVEGDEVESRFIKCDNGTELWSMSIRLREIYWDEDRFDETGWKKGDPEFVMERMMPTGMREYWDDVCKPRYPEYPGILNNTYQTTKQKVMSISSQLSTSLPPWMRSEKKRRAAEEGKEKESPESKRLKNLAVHTKSIETECKRLRERASELWGPIGGTALPTIQRQRSQDSDELLVVLRRFGMNPPTSSTSQSSSDYNDDGDDDVKRSRRVYDDDDDDTQDELKSESKEEKKTKRLPRLSLDPEEYEEEEEEEKGEQHTETKQSRVDFEAQAREEAIREQMLLEDMIASELRYHIQQAEEEDTEKAKKNKAVVAVVAEVEEETQEDFNDRIWGAIDKEFSKENALRLQILASTETKTEDDDQSPRIKTTKRRRAITEDEEENENSSGLSLTTSRPVSRPRLTPVEANDDAVPFYQVPDEQPTRSMSSSSSSEEELERTRSLESYSPTPPALEMTPSQ
jgi:hypothetical protein